MGKKLPRSTHLNSSFGAAVKKLGIALMETSSINHKENKGSAREEHLRSTINQAEIRKSIEAAEKLRMLKPFGTSLSGTNIDSSTDKNPRYYHFVFATGPRACARPCRRIARPRPSGSQIRAAIRQASGMVIQTFSFSTMSATSVSVIHSAGLTWCRAQLYPRRRRGESRGGAQPGLATERLQQRGNPRSVRGERPRLAGQCASDRARGGPKVKSGRHLSGASTKSSGRAENA
jgi:hypothetical protein